jgi:hypothetical protein
MVDGTLRPLKSVKVRDSGGTLRTVFSGLKVSSNFTSFTGFGSYEPVISSPTCVVTPTGGTAPYTYAWTLVGTSGLGLAAIDAPTSASTTFSATSLSDFLPLEATFRCTVTDAGSVVGTIDVRVSFTKFGNFGFGGIAP